MMETSLNVYDYPEPNEVAERNVKVTVMMSYTVDINVPVDWDDDKIMEYIREENEYLTHYNEEIDDMEIR